MIRVNIGRFIYKANHFIYYQSSDSPLSVFTLEGDSLDTDALVNQKIFIKFKCGEAEFEKQIFIYSTYSDKEKNKYIIYGEDL